MYHRIRAIVQCFIKIIYIRIVQHNQIVSKWSPAKLLRYVTGYFPTPNTFRRRNRYTNITRYRCNFDIKLPRVFN